MAYTTINKSTAHFNTKLYNGTGSSNSITGVGFQPDFTWIKRRNSATNHHLHNAISGATKVLYSNSSAAESTDAQNLSSFDSDGFTVGTNGDANNSSGTFASWNWKANGAGSSNTDGSINSTVSVNTTAGFSIVSYTGTSANATVGHGLGAVPKMMIFKNRSSSYAWPVYHVGIGATKYMYLSTTDAAGTFSGHFQDTAPSSSIITLGSDVSVNSGNMIAYCFAEKTGYSKFGSLTGNGSTDGTFVYCGFAPAFIIVKAITSGNWFMYDNKRPGYNNVQQFLEADGNAAEYTSNANHSIDIVSNGFKFTGGSGSNTAGRECIFMAFGQSLVGSNNVPCTAR